MRERGAHAAPSAGGGRSRGGRGRGRGRTVDGPAPKRGAKPSAAKGGSAASRGRGRDRACAGSAARRRGGRSAPTRRARPGPRRRAGRGPPGRARAAAGRAAQVRELWVADDLDDAAVIDDIVDLAADAARADRGGQPEAARRPGPHRGAPGRARPGRAAARGRPRRPARARPRRRGAVPRGRSTASPTRATSAPCCARPSAPASPASCCPGTARCTSRPPSPRRRPAPSSTCRWPSWPACRRPWRALQELGVLGRSASTTPPTARCSSSTSLDRAGGAGARGRGRGPRRLVRQRCDLVVSIPLRGHLASLNVSAAGALACFEVARAREATAAG